MGIKEKYATMMERHDAANQRRAEKLVALQAKSTSLQQQRDSFATYGEYRIMGNFMTKTINRSLKGATVDIETGAERGRPTLTRVTAGAIIAGPAGAVVGGLFKKDKTRIYVTIEFADGDVAVIDGPVSDEKKLRNFARVAAKYARE